MQIQPKDFTAAKPVFNRAEIMKAAHASVAFDRMTSSAARRERYSDLLAARLRYEWAQAKERAAKATQTATERRVDAIKTSIADLPNKSFRVDTAAEKQRLQAELAELTGEGTTDPDTPADSIEAKRDLINAASGRFCAVVFEKKDGTLRTMRIQPAKLKFHCKGEDASESAQKAVQTRKERHPHLMPVWDAEKAAPRSVNLLTVQRITVDGTTHQFAPVQG